MSKYTVIDHRTGNEYDLFTTSARDAAKVVYYKSTIDPLPLDSINRDPYQPNVYHLWAANDLHMGQFEVLSY